MIPSWPERSLDRRPHHILVVLFGECAERLCTGLLTLACHLDGSAASSTMPRVLPPCAGLA